MEPDSHVPQENPRNLVVDATPWTPGPWIVTDRSVGRTNFTPDPAYSDVRTRTSHLGGPIVDRAWTPNAELIALAPEMAEAILALKGPCSEGDSTMYPDGCEHSCQYGEDYVCGAHAAADVKLAELAEKLRQIGGAS